MKKNEDERNFLFQNAMTVIFMSCKSLAFEMQNTYLSPEKSQSSFVYWGKYTCNWKLESFLYFYERLRKRSKNVCVLITS